MAVGSAAAQPLDATPQVAYHGGMLLTHVQVQEIFLGSGWNSSPANQQDAQALNGYLQYLTNSPYMDMLGEYYEDLPFVGPVNVGRGSVVGAEVTNDAFPSGYQINDYLPNTYSTTGPRNDMENYLVREIQSGNVVRPNDWQTLYVIFLPPGVHTVQCDTPHYVNGQTEYATGYHYSFFLPTGSSGGLTTGDEINYAVIPYPGDGSNVLIPGLPNPFDNQTAAVSHELAEAVTDPYNFLITDNNGIPSGNESGWWSPSGEIGDLAEGYYLRLNGYVVQAEWSAAQGGIVGPAGATRLTTGSASGGGGLALESPGTVMGPVASDQSYQVNSNGTLTVPASAGLLASATDPFNNPLQAVLLTSPANGSVRVNPDGSFTYTPNANFSGTDTFTYAASDGSFQSPPATVSIQVTPPLGNLSLNDPLATEGLPESGVTVATFTDTNPEATAGDFTATITWGDSSGSAADSIVSLGGGLFAVVGSHTYAEETNSPLALSVQVADTSGASLSGSLPISVADAPLGNLVVNDPGATEGVRLNGATVATFTDANAAAPVTDFTATIAWGDGSTGAADGVVALGGGLFGVVGSHTYAEEANGPLALAVDVRDVGGSEVSGVINTGGVADASLSHLVVSNPGATENVGFTGFTVATFRDANATAPASDFTATITWGDGSSGAADGVVALGGGLFAVVGSHTYAAAGTYTLAVGVQDVGGSEVSGRAPTAVADAPLGGLNITDPGATEGVGFSGFTVATFTDANSAASATGFTATVTWGDGTSGAATVVATGTPGTFAVLASHSYAEEGTRTLSVQVLDAGGASVSGTRAVAVADAPLGGLSLNDPGATEGAGFSGFTVATFTDANSAAPAKDFTATVTWGDGTTGAASVVATGTPGTFAVLAGHTYKEETTGPTTLSVLVRDKGGASVSGGIALTVADATLSSLTVNAPGAVAGAGTGTFTVATFHDGNGTAPPSDFVATIGWGDGTTTTVSGAAGGIVAEGDGMFAVRSSHTYAAAGNFDLSVQVADVGGSSLGGTTGVGVNPPPSPPSPPPPSGGGSSSGPNQLQAFLDLLIELYILEVLLGS
jgi:hypothetical protein